MEIVDHFIFMQILHWPQIVYKLEKTSVTECNRTKFHIYTILRSRVEEDDFVVLPPALYRVFKIFAKFWGTQTFVSGHFYMASWVSVHIYLLTFCF